MVSTKQVSTTLAQNGLRKIYDYQKKLAEVITSLSVVMNTNEFLSLDSSVRREIESARKEIQSGMVRIDKITSRYGYK